MTLDTTWAGQVVQHPLLRALTPADRQTLTTAGRLHHLLQGAHLYRSGDPGDSLYLVLDGRLSVRAVRRGDERASELRTVDRGDTVGEEALLPGLPRRAAVVALTDTRLAEIPASLLQRLVGRAGREAGERAERERRMLMRMAARDLIATHALTRELPDIDRDILVDAAHFRQVQRGERLYSVGDLASECYLVIDGLVQLQVDDDQNTRALAYLVGGDVLGAGQSTPGERRTLTAVAMGATHLLQVPIDVLRSISDRHPDALRQANRIATTHKSAQAKLLDQAQQQTTQHVFRDLYRMQMARSLLVIDQDQCVRCGHCAWSCAAVHGHSRLVRRGDKILARVGSQSGGPSSLLVPNSCQHCRHAACMIDCPTGAIGRDPEGEVFIRPELCTGCGRCAKSCPWENIRMEPRAPGVARPTVIGSSESPATAMHDDIAVKCDLCRDYQAPACVQSCPTGALVRLDPSRDIAELGAFLGTAHAEPKAADAPRESAAPGQRRARRTPMLHPWAIAIAVAGVPWAWSLHRSGDWTARDGLGLVAGLLAALAVLALAGYLVPKRLVKRAMRPRARRSAARNLADSAQPARNPQTLAALNATRSRTRSHLRTHIVLGFLALVLVAGHAGTRVPTSPAGAAHVAFWLTALLGIFGLLCYRMLPGRITRLERRGALPEDMVQERAELQARLFRATSGADERIKHVLSRFLIPYARHPLGPLTLLLSGRTLAEEERRLQQRIDDESQEDGGRPLAIAPLVRIVVEMRALPIRRWGTWLLRAWLPVHVVMTTVLITCVLLHVITAVSL